MASGEDPSVEKQADVSLNGDHNLLLTRDDQQIDLFRSGRATLRRSKCDNLVMAIFKICFCSLGLWGHGLCNYIPRVLVGAIVVYQAVYDFYVVLGCPGFDCGFLQNSTDKNKTSHHKDDRKIANAVYTIFTVAAVISYFLFIGCFIATRRNPYVETPSESLDANNNDVDKKNTCCLCFAFTVITTLFLCSVAVFYAIIWKSQPRNSFFDTLATGVGAQFFAQWTAITTCHVFAVSSFALCTFAEDALRQIENLEQNKTLDDVINIYENLCKVVFNTVSAYSVWFVVHWFSYGAGVVLSVIYISKEFLERNKYGTPTLNLVYLGLFFVCHVYLFLLPCVFAARITNSCSGIWEKINCRTTGYWSEGHPLRDRSQVTMFVAYAERRRCGFKVGRITFNTSLAWLSFFFGLTGLLYHFF